MMETPRGFGGPGARHMVVEQVPRIAALDLVRSARLAGDGPRMADLELELGGISASVTLVRHSLHQGGYRWALICEDCDVERRHLYYVDGRLSCRVCHRLPYMAWTYSGTRWLEERRDGLAP